MAYAPIYDGNFSTAQEVHPSPVISTDEITRSRLWFRTMAVGVSSYVAQAQGTADPYISGGYLINESDAGIVGPVKFYQRNYAEVPGTRMEVRMIPFTMPGKSAVVTSDISSLPIGWNPYGVAAPFTQQMLADVDYSYVFVPTGTNPRSLFTIPDLTQLTFDDRVVDYTGDVYESIGQATVVQGGGLPDIIEERYAYAGTVTGWSEGQDWVVSVDIRRWRGPIWEMEVVTVPNLLT